MLLHNTKTSTSLLKQLGVQHQLKFLDTASPPHPPSRPGLMVKTFSAGLGVIRLGGDQGAAFVAPLVDGAEENGELRTDIYGPQPFRTWWNRPVLEDLRDEHFTRKELVLFLAHKLGGAHVDPELQPRGRGPAGAPLGGLYPPLALRQPGANDAVPRLRPGMAFKLVQAAQDRWRRVNAPHLVALVRAGATFIDGQALWVETPHPSGASTSPGLPERATTRMLSRQTRAATPLAAGIPSLQLAAL